MNTIVLFTSNFKGGIVQLSVTLAETLTRLGYEVTLFLPDTADDVPAPVFTIERYRRFKNILPNNAPSARVAARIAHKKPGLVVFCDEGIISAQTLCALKGRWRTVFVLHDVSPHPETLRLLDRLKQGFELYSRKHALRAAGRVVLLSENSLRLFDKLYAPFADKALLMPLGAHLPDAAPKKPQELAQLGGYYLFFGRISRYKGIVNLLRAYDRVGEKLSVPLVVAGNGRLEPEEDERAQRNNSVFLINRFIEDGEMLWLVQNARAVVLPYIEASQSGVLPIAYAFGVPVIAADVAGLREVVLDGETGLISRGDAALDDALLRLQDDGLRARLSQGARLFYEQHLNWEENLKSLLGGLKL
ncbi:glycosyltransferase family 4 protein [Oscillospiraceae bacterium WX1]